MTSATDELRRMLDERLAALIECCDETDRLIIDTRRFADLEDENAKLREQGERLFDKTLELATENVRMQDENARLRSCLSDDAENARMIMAENEKLMELAVLNWEWAHSCCGNNCKMQTDGCGYGIDRECNYEHEIADCMRELGIEVDDA